MVDPASRGGSEGVVHPPSAHRAVSAVENVERVGRPTAHSEYL